VANVLQNVILASFFGIRRFGSWEHNCCHTNGVRTKVISWFGTEFLLYFLVMYLLRAVLVIPGTGDRRPAPEET